MEQSLRRGQKLDGRTDLGMDGKAVDSTYREGKKRPEQLVDTVCGGESWRLEREMEGHSI